MCIRYEFETSAIVTWAMQYGLQVAGLKSSQFFPGSKNGLIIIDDNGWKAIPDAYWGLTPHWVKDDKFGKKSAYNARAETIDEKPTFRNAFRSRRCLIPATAFYERADGHWLKFFPENQEAFAFAGLYESANKICTTLSYSIVTTEPNAFVAKIHDRMPVILSPDKYQKWLGNEKETKAIMVACDKEYLKFEDAGPVSRKKD